MKYYIFILIVCFDCNSAFSTNKDFIISANCLAAYDAYLSLQVDEGNKLLNKETIANPNNTFQILLADYQDCIRLLFTNEVQLYEQKKGNFNNRLEILSQANQHSPWFLFAQAEVYFHWALVQFRLGETTNAFFHFRKSFQLLETNQKMFPQFAPNKMLLAVATALLGTIPDQYQWFIALFGMKGNVKLGMLQLENYLQQKTNKVLFHQEALLYLVYIKYYYAGQQEAAYNLVISDKFQPKNNLMHAFVVANFSLNYRKSNLALPLLDYWIKKGVANQYPILFYEMGEALLMKTDSKCIYYYQQFLQQSKSVHFKQDALLKIAYAYAIQQNWVKANSYLDAISKMPDGMLDADQYAKKFAKQKKWISPLLLQSKLLFDGGNTEMSLTTVQKVAVQTLNNSDKIEYHFRLGRIHDEWKQWSLAEFHYKKTIELGSESTSYHAARASLQLGFMYEHLGKIKESLYFFNLSRNMKNKDFRQSIEQQAKAGINRLTK